MDGSRKRAYPFEYDPVEGWKDGKYISASKTGTEFDRGKHSKQREDSYSKGPRLDENGNVIRKWKDRAVGKRGVRTRCRHRGESARATGTNKTPWRAFDPSHARARRFPGEKDNTRAKCGRRSPHSRRCLRVFDMSRGRGAVRVAFGNLEEAKKMDWRWKDGRG
ncbi:hypothetical protein SCHPADRAFT_947803 [Schizopora paradoxa]|uniref:Uncharacterized protein n=1 Tax=Schizopora paradoxa TaxID=27342 RepID=A0A0H2R494_9AGAM|nr:hypothetical protein SCHPADRAFT_947803 [Schizopora paradoxa]